MSSMIITLDAFQDNEIVSECSAELDLNTFEITGVEDVEFLDCDTYHDEFGMRLGDKLYPIAVDKLTTGNEFMVMDADAIDAIKQYAAENPDEVDAGEYPDNDGDEDE